jgi:16S rRNA (uracil1498-N3)-methyltransferase
MKPSRRTPRLLVDVSPRSGQLHIEANDSHYLSSVLRLRAGDEVVAFDARGHEWLTRAATLTRRGGVLEVLAPIEPLPESSLHFTLVQALVKAEAMDLIVQKATELGVTRILPVRTEFSVVKLDSDRAEKRMQHWLKIARSACEQSGRHRPPEIGAPVDLTDCLTELTRSHDVVVVLDPRAPTAAMALPERPASAAAIVGPEGGFGPRDERDLDAARCTRWVLGPRTLRADTAAIAVCVEIQRRWGDLQ